MATQSLKAIGALKLGKATKAPSQITITGPGGGSVLLGSEAKSAEEIVKYTGLNNIPIDGTTVTISYTPIPKSDEVDNVVVSGIKEKAVDGTNIVAWGTDGIMSLTAKIPAVVG